MLASKINYHVAFAKRNPLLFMIHSIKEGWQPASVIVGKILLSITDMVRHSISLLQQTTHYKRPGVCVLTSDS